MAKVRVDVGVACSGSQHYEWWVAVMGELLRSDRGGIEIGAIHAVGSALPDHNKNHTIEDKRRHSLTDVNRNKISGGFLRGKADWIWWLDDDTVPPEGALQSLLAARRPFVAGLYFLPRPPFHPIAYYREPDGLYKAVYHYPRGALVRVDSVGMGCTLIHRSVYEQIAAGHTVFQRPNGSIFPIHKSKVAEQPEAVDATERVVNGGAYILPVKPVDLAQDTRPFPFYAMEYVRTEDHHFCELAAAVGVEPWLDTAVECDHLKVRGHGRKDYLAARRYTQEVK